MEEKTLFGDFTKLRWVKWTERKPTFNGSVVVRYNGKNMTICHHFDGILTLNKFAADEEILKDLFWMEEIIDSEGFNEWRQEILDEEEFSKSIDPERLDFGWVCRYFRDKQTGDLNTDMLKAVDLIHEHVLHRGNEFNKDAFSDFLSPREIKYLISKKKLEHYPETEEYFEHYIMNYEAHRLRGAITGKKYGL